MPGSDSDRPIADGVEGLSQLRDRDVPEAAGAVFDLVKGDVENVRRLVDRARRHVDPELPAKLHEAQQAMEAAARTLGDEVSAAVSVVVDELESVRRPTVEANSVPVLDTPTDTELPVIRITSTSKEHAKIRRNPPPNHVVVLDETVVYTTDHLGRVERAEATIADAEPGRRNKHAQRTLPGKLPGDDAGHLIARVLGGSGDKINLVPMERRTVNQGEYRAVEQHWEQAVAEGKTVDLSIEIDYEDDGPRPTEFFVTYEIDGEQYFAEIGNPLPEGES